MEGRDGVVGGSGGVTVVGSDVPSDYHVAPRSENPSQTPGSGPSPASGQPVGAGPAVAGLRVQKKRGRPRKYSPDGSVPAALSPRPISSAAPPRVIDFSAQKRGKVKTAGSLSKPKFGVENLGNHRSLCVFSSFKEKDLGAFSFLCSKL